MTHDEWLSCSEPRDMLRWLYNQERLSQQKARLFAVAICRRIWPLLTDSARHAVDSLERLADGVASPEELRVPAAGQWPDPFRGDTLAQFAAVAAAHAVRAATILCDESDVARFACQAAGHAAASELDESLGIEFAAIKTAAISDKVGALEQWG